MASLSGASTVAGNVQGVPLIRLSAPYEQHGGGQMLGTEPSGTYPGSAWTLARALAELAALALAQPAPDTETLIVLQCILEALCTNLA